MTAKNGKGLIRARSLLVRPYAFACPCVCLWSLPAREICKQHLRGIVSYNPVVFFFSYSAFLLTGTHKIVVEKDGKLEFDSGGYHFASSVRSAGNGTGSGGMVRARRLAQEVSSLATSLPLSCSSSVFVRCDKERLDVMKVMTKKM